MSLDSYWNIKESEVKPPVMFFREQARTLSKVTNGILDGTVEVYPLENVIRSELWILAPLLNNYKYLLLRVHHPLSLYPAVLHILPNIVQGKGDETRAEIKRCQTPEEFDTAFKDALSSSEVVKVIQSLLAMSKSS
jgi:hypothetical protein